VVALEPARDAVAIRGTRSAIRGGRSRAEVAVAWYPAIAAPGGGAVDHLDESLAYEMSAKRATPWVCGVCRAVNEPRWATCYSCRAPASLALDPRSTDAPRRRAPEPPELASIARSAGARYESSSGRATFAVLAITLVLVLHVSQYAAELAAISILGDVESVSALSATGVAQLATASGLFLALFGLEVVAWAVGFVAWGGWLSRVVANVPALGGGWPKSTPREAFLASLVPLYNMYWSTASLRDALTRLSPPGRARIGLLTAWWFVLGVAVLPFIGLIPGPLFVLRLGYQAVATYIAAILTAITGSEFSPAIFIGLISSAILTAAAVLAVMLIEHVEHLQQRRAEELRMAPPPAPMAETRVAGARAGITARGTTDVSGSARRPAAAVPLPLVEVQRAVTTDARPATAGRVRAAAGLEPTRDGTLRARAPHAPRERVSTGGADAPRPVGASQSDLDNPELDAFIESLALMNRDEAAAVNRLALASGIFGGSQWGTLIRELDSAAAASRLEAERAVARGAASRASSRSPARVGNRYLATDEAAAVWAEVIVLHDHLPDDAIDAAFEPWRDVLMPPAWLRGEREKVVGDTGFEPVTSRM
jgi:hypothetical protein